MSLTEEYLLRGLVSIILDSAPGMATCGPTEAPTEATEAKEAPPPCLELGRPSAAAGVCGRFREATGCLGGGVVGGLPAAVVAAAAASDQAASIMAAAEAAALLSEVEVEVTVEVALAEAEVAEAEGGGPLCPATGMAKKALGLRRSDTCALKH